MKANLSTDEKRRRRLATQRKWNQNAVKEGYFKKRGLEDRRKLRNAVLDLLGRFCNKCGYSTDVRALQVDHINGGGNKEIAKGYYPMYRRILKNPKGYQILCANCNWIKRYEKEEVIYYG